MRRTVTSEPAVKKVDTATSVVEVSRPNCESTPIEKVTVITTPIIKEEPKMVEKEVEVKEEPKKEVKKEVEKIVIDLKSVTKEKAKSPLLTPIEEESMNIHPYLLEYGTEPFKSDILLIQNEMYQPNKKKNKKKKNQPNVFSEE